MDVHDTIIAISGPFIPLYSHQVLDDKFPGICFLGEPQEVAVQSEPVTLSPPGLGVTLKIPPNAVQSSDEPVTISLRACLSSTVFQYPKGCTQLSAVYHISTDSAFNKDIELTIEHFADLKTDKQANEMKFFRTEAEENGKYRFTPIEGGVFKVGGHRCTISTRLVPSFVSAGSIPSSQIGKQLIIMIHLYIRNRHCAYIKCTNQNLMRYIFLQGNAILCYAATLITLTLSDMLLLPYHWMMQCSLQ